MNCPKCQSDNTQRLSLIYEAGTQNIKTSSSTIGSGIGRGGFGVGTARTTTTGTSQSVMAQKLAPPPKKGFKVVSILVIISIILLYAEVIGLAIIPIGIAIFLAYKAISYNNGEWKNLYETWTTQWHCNKCGSIYVA